jgi:putative inorganic carbon (HCO3(-)) transporter
MITDALLLLMFLVFVSLGVLSPFVWSLGYVWVDTFLPHRLSYSVMSSMPVAFIMGAGAVVSYLLVDRRAPPRITAIQVMCGLMAIWITLTSTWAVAPAAAWLKWDTSFKTVIFVCFMPFVFRTRVQIEAFVLVMLFAAAGHLLPWGVKTLLTGGGYKQSLGLLGSNTTMLAESSSVAAIAVMFVPLLVWMRTHSILIPWPRARAALSYAMIVLYMVANIGTFARTGLVAIGVLGSVMLVRSKRKIVFLTIAAMLGGVMVTVMSNRWEARVSTITNYEQDGSAATRILVWKWTLGFAVDHPLGGGFESFTVNVIPNPDTGGLQYGRAFHNIFFAALGEHGYPGLALYLAILTLSLVSMQRVAKRCRDHPDLAWAGDLARATQVCLLILMACGNFVDISFSFIIWDMVAVMMCLRNHVEQVLRQPAGARSFGGSQASALLGPRGLLTERLTDMPRI